jgi:GT2 family glycosyltransferase
MIDNASTDGSLTYVKENFPELRLISLDSNYGFTGGYNLGLEQLRGQYETFILLNTDVEVTPGWDQSLVDFIVGHPDYAAVQPKIRSWKDRTYFDYAGAGGGFVDSLGYPYCRGRIWDHLEQDSGQYDDTIQVDWASGACLAINATDFYAHEGFDGSFFAHMEEIDLCWRLRKSGRKIGYLGSAVVYHQGGATLDRASAQKLYLNCRNSLSMLYKNVGFLRFAAIFFAKGFFEGLAALNYVRKGEPEFAKAILQAYGDFLSSQKVKSPVVKTNLPEVVGNGPVGVIFAYFLLLGKRKFTDL